MSIHEQDTSGAAREVRLLDLGAVVLRRWRMVAGVATAVLLAAACFSMLAPKRYSARVLMLPPPEQNAGGQAQVLASQFAGIPGMGALGGINQKVIGVIARSEALRDSLVQRLAGPGGLEEGTLRLTLGRYTEVEERPDGSVAVMVTARDPKVAARVANEFPALINQISAQMSAEAALQKEAFLEGQLRRAQSRLELSEQALVAYQQGRNAPDIQEQARQTVDAAAELQAQIVAQERRVNQLARTSTASNPALRAAQADLATLRSQLARLTAGGGGQLFVPFRESASLKANMTRLTREYAKDEKVYLSLTAALAEAQIDVNNDLPVVSVLDRAEVPTQPAGFGLKLVLAVASILGLVLGLIVAFVAEHLSWARGNPQGRAFFSAWVQFKRDLRRGGLPSRGPALASKPE